MPNPVMQWQIVANDAESVAAFYCDLFGWTLKSDNAFGYRELQSGEPRGADGGVWPAQFEGRNFVQLFIEVDDVDAAIAKAASLGASVIVPKSALPDGDVMAVLQDPAGMSFGLRHRT
jgi:predicted enzyme related to lactoylglutathione lyase